MLRQPDIVNMFETETLKHYKGKDRIQDRIKR